MEQDRLLNVEAIPVSDDVAMCSSCGESKPRSMFGDNRWRKKGIQSRCKLCTKADVRKLRGVDPQVASLESLPHAKCDICRTDTRRLFLDHDHVDGRMRGWLCYRCNTGLGLLGDTEDALVSAWIYLWTPEAFDEFMEVASRLQSGGPRVWPHLL